MQKSDRAGCVYRTKRMRVDGNRQPKQGLPHRTLPKNQLAIGADIAGCFIGTCRRQGTTSETAAHADVNICQTASQPGTRFVPVTRVGVAAGAAQLSNF